MTPAGLVVLMIINYGTPDGEVLKLIEPMPTLEVCFQTQRELLEAALPDIRKAGISVACYLRLVGDPA